MGNYYLIGEHLSHSFSPELHRAFGRYEYKCKELSPEELNPFLAARDFAGLNVTIPYKQAVIPYLDRLDKTAAAVGAVNVIVNRDGVLWGYNTDVNGMKAALQTLLQQNGQPGGPEELPARIAPLYCLILGTGGTSKTALAVCRDLGAAEIRRVSRTGREGALTYEEASRSGGPAAKPGVLINTTPVGMHPNADGIPIDLSAFPKLTAVFDCIYNPLRTRLVLAAQARGIPAAGGLEMLVLQAALSCGLFTGAPVPEEEIAAICNSVHRTRENLVLIGMPGAGKTTVGRILAQKTGRQFVDLDEEIEKQAGKRISAIFAEQGEAAFRDLESELIRDLARTGGRILATGGGSVLRPENVTRLKQNGSLFLLDRPPEDLQLSRDRPLGDTREKVAALYRARHSIYLAAADRIIRDPADPDAAADAILRAARNAP